jgi:seryl-tRNA synthetase
MHDIRAIRDNPAAFDQALRRRGLAAQSSEILALDSDRRAKIAESEGLQARANALSRQAGQAKSRNDLKAFDAVRAEVTEARTKIARLADEAKAADQRLSDLLAAIPNLPADDVPDGPDESFNREIRREGTPRRFAFKPREHFEVAAATHGLDFETAARLSGSRFVILKGAMARLHRALSQFMLDIHTLEHGLTEVWTPVLVRPEAMFGTNQLPKFAEDSYQTTNGWWLIPTSEVSLTNMVAGQILEAATLPLRWTAHSQCFRSEAGSAGKDTVGMLRHHQFEKVEMVSITTPENSEAEQQRMTDCAENILRKLALPFRTIVLSTGDMGFGARRTHDIEVWLPGQNTYREISSVSTCGAFQARRMNARFRGKDGKPEFVHTLNGSGLAVGRTLIAVIENGQEADGSITLPPALGPWIGGKTRITPEGQLV